MNQSLISVASQGGGAHAIHVMSGAAEVLARAIRRAVPFLGRRGVHVRAGEPQLSSTEAVGSDFREPAYVAHLVAEPGGARARLCFDADAIAFLMDGSLCGDGSKVQKLTAKGLTPPQKAFIEQLAGSVVGTISSSLEMEIGLALTPIDVRSGGATGSLVAIELSFIDDKKEEEGDEEEDFLFEDDEADAGDEAPVEDEIVCHGRILLAISKSALMTARVRSPKQTEEIDERVVETMGEVPVEVVAELGRIVMSVAELGQLAVGTTLRMPVAVNGAVDVRVEDVPMFKGRPTTSGSQLAVRLVEDKPVGTLMPSGLNEDLHESLRPAPPPQPVNLQV